MTLPAYSKIGGETFYLYHQKGKGTKRTRCAVGICEECGKEFPYVPSRTTRRFCNKTCSAIFRSRQGALPVGTRRTENGYVWLKTGYGRSNRGPGWELEHRYVIRTHLGRDLDETEIVHHINGDRSDNRLENLQVLHKTKHTPGQAHQCLDCGSHNIVSTIIQ